MTQDEGFAAAPQSIGEIKASRAHDASLQSPRDALISVLRDIDQGKIKPDAIVICFRELKAPGTTYTNYEASTPDLHTGLGLLAWATARIMSVAERDAD